MMQDTPYIIVTTTMDDEEAAGHITQVLLESRLAACVQASTVQSSFWWNGQIQQTEEIRLQAKAPADHVDAILAAIREAHPYEVPEIIVTPILAGHPPYLDWLENETRLPEIEDAPDHE
ncbi:MAG: divalent-cation tolerance protein CutA [Kiritimatiellia bacterium]